MTMSRYVRFERLNSASGKEERVVVILVLQDTLAGSPTSPTTQ